MTFLSFYSFYSITVCRSGVYTTNIVLVVFSLLMVFIFIIIIINHSSFEKKNLFLVFLYDNTTYILRFFFSFLYFLPLVTRNFTSYKPTHSSWLPGQATLQAILNEYTDTWSMDYGVGESWKDTQENSGREFRFSANIWNFPRRWLRCSSVTRKSQIYRTRRKVYIHPAPSRYIEKWKANNIWQRPYKGRAFNGTSSGDGKVKMYGR